MQTATCRGVQQASSLDEDGALLRTLTGREEIDEGQLLEELLREQRVLLAARNGDEGALRRLHAPGHGVACACEQQRRRVVILVRDKGLSHLDMDNMW